MNEVMFGERATVEAVKQASKDYLRQAKARRVAAHVAREKANVGFRMLRHGKFVRIIQEDAASYWHGAAAEKVDEIVSGATSLSYSEEPEEDRFVKWDLEIVSGGKKIKMGARHFLGGPSYASGYIDPFEHKPYVLYEGKPAGGEELYTTTGRFKDFIDNLKSQGIIGTKVAVKA
ncbi:MAG: hypothetical protein AAB512_00920 [Patescibacteria group bacterium]